MIPIPAGEGHPDVSAGNLLGTVLYFVLFNLGLIALATPVRVPALTPSSSSARGSPRCSSGVAA